MFTILDQGATNLSLQLVVKKKQTIIFSGYKISTVGQFYSTGTVIRTTVVRMLEFEKEYICTKCRTIFTEKVLMSHYE